MLSLPSREPLLLVNSRVSVKLKFQENTIATFQNATKGGPETNVPVLQVTH